MPYRRDTVSDGLEATPPVCWRSVLVSPPLSSSSSAPSEMSPTFDASHETQNLLGGMDWDAGSNEGKTMSDFVDMGLVTVV